MPCTPNRRPINIDDEWSYCLSNVTKPWGQLPLSSFVNAATFFFLELLVTLDLTLFFSSPIVLHSSGKCCSCSFCYELYSSSPRLLTREPRDSNWLGRKIYFKITPKKHNIDPSLKNLRHVKNSRWLFSSWRNGSEYTTWLHLKVICWASINLLGTSAGLAYCSHMSVLLDCTELTDRNSTFIYLRREEFFRREYLPVNSKQ